MNKCLLLLLTLSPLSAAQITLCAEDQNFPPFLYYNNPDKQGILVDIIEAIGNETDIDIKIIRLPWNRCKSMVASNEVQGMFAAIWTPERETEYAFPKNAENRLDENRYLWEVHYTIFTHINNDSLQWQNEQFTNLNMGLSAPPGYVAHEKLKTNEALFAGNIMQNEGLQMVAANRLDGYILEEKIGWQTVNELGLDKQIKTIANPFIQTKWYVPLAKEYVAQNPDEANLFWHKLAEIRQRDFE